MNTYLTDIRYRVDYAAIREEFFGKKMPAHTLVAVAALVMPEFLIEVWRQSLFSSCATDLSLANADGLPVA